MKRAAAGLLLALAACRSAAPPQPTAPPGGVIVRFGVHAIAAEVADSKDEWHRGLMSRTHLGRDAGMLFVFPVRVKGSFAFYMFRTLIPLQIAFFQRSGDGYRVVGLREMVPCREDVARKCKTYAPGTPYDVALEANKGWFTKAGVEVGDAATLERPRR